MIRSVLPESDNEQIRSIMGEFRLRYDRSDYRSPKAYPRIMDLLRRLNETHVTLHVATNKPRKPTLRILQRIGAGAEFNMVVTPDLTGKSILSKVEMLHHILTNVGLNPRDVAFVGDSASNIAGIRSGVFAIGVTYGYTAQEGIEAARPRCMVHSVEQFTRLTEAY